MKLENLDTENFGGFLSLILSSLFWGGVVLSDKWCFGNTFQPEDSGMAIVFLWFVTWIILLIPCYLLGCFIAFGLRGKGKRK